nr:ATP-dependent helicase HrpB [Sandaracinus amylolyticus]
MPIEALPIDPFLPEITAAARAGNLVLVAEPGAGKTTRVPRALLLESGLADAGEIVVLEPRRIATRMAAKRVAEELGEEVGGRVGYTVRFDDVSSARTRVRFVTEGVLTRRLVADPTLRGVSCVVLDELHERSLHADLALAMVRALQRAERPDLRLVAMSATLEAERVASFLDAPVVRVPGRRYEVTIEHAEGADDRPLERRVAAAVKRALRESSEGHVLVFLPGAAEIRRAAEALEEGARALDVDVLPLHGDLPPAEQDRAVRPSARRKVILATNVAETSLTIDGVVAVVDSGLARVARHSPWSGLPTLETEPICQASATQRAGRAGRTRAGRAIRLYTKHDHDTRPRHDAPEIQRVDLADTVLALRARGVRDVLEFPFFEAPPRAAIVAADRLLSLLGATTHEGALTGVGRDLLALPLHPRLGRVVLEADAHGLGARGATLAALLAERDLRMSMRTRMSRDRDHAHESGTSDAVHRLELFETVAAQGVSASRLRAHELDVAGGMAAARASEQIVRALKRVKGRPSEHADLDEDAILRRALLAGFPDRVARRRRAKEPEVVLAGGGSARLAETSVVREPELMVAIDAEERRGAIEVRTASAIEAEWLLEMLPDAIEDVRELRFDPKTRRIEKIAALRYLGLTIDESRGDAAGEPGAAAVLARALMEQGIDRLIDREALAQLRLRLALARKVDPSLPELDDARLLSVLEQASEGRRSVDEVKGAGLFDLLLADLGHDVTSKLDRLAPDHVSLPGRKRVAVHYEVDRPPWIESRMQDFFGWLEGPRIGGEPVVLHLLAPNQRAVQVTTDLAGFWDRHYPTLRKELMRRYPRHAWPDDPRKPLPPK